MPKDGMAIVNLASAQVTTVDRVRRFAMPEKAAGYLVYQREAAEKPAAAPADPTGGNGDQQQGGRGGRGGGGAAGAGGASARTQFGSDLVLRALVDGTERTFTDRSEEHTSELQSL